MTFDFDTFVERRSSGSAKWNWFDHDVLPMWVADMDFKVTPVIVDALKERAEHGIFGYPVDTPELREALISRLASRHNMQVHSDNLVMIPGLVMGLNFVSHVVGAPGDSVLTLAPIYPPFLSAPKNQGRDVQMAALTVSRTGNRLYYEIDFDALEAALTPQTKLFMLCNPHNPVGRVWTRAELEGIADFCLRHDLIISSDEIHCDLVYADFSHISIASLSPEVAARTITLLAPSKTFNIPGLGMGFAVVQDKTLHAKLHDWVHGNGAGVNVMGLTAALAAFTGGQPWLDDLLHYLQENRDVATAYIDQNMPEIATTCPEGTYLMWLDCRALPLPEGKTAHTYFLEQGRVAVNDGAAFGIGGDGFTRLNFGTTRATLLEGLGRMKSAYDKLKLSAG